MINGWEIDFYVKPIDTYVQFDGVYWHGLDRCLEEIAKHKTPRDVVIHDTWKRDCEQNKWFTTNDTRLVRVTDLQFKENASSCLDLIGKNANG